MPKQVLGGSSLARWSHAPQKPKVILPSGPDELIHFSTLLLPEPFARERLFYAALFARLHVEAVLLDFFDDVFLLHFPLKSP
jgi:hypothetical protein